MGKNIEEGRDMGNSEKKGSGIEMRSSEDWGGERDEINASLSPKACSYVHVLLVIVPLPVVSLPVKSPPEGGGERERERAEWRTSEMIGAARRQHRSPRMRKATQPELGRKDGKWSRRWWR